MSAVPPKCPQCKRDLRYDLAALRYSCPACDASETAGRSGNVWRERGQTVGRGIARFMRLVERWLRR
jgi:predicted RNA-binding Zn-ribbon protein involved in translation (DUF1610 family)